MLASLKVADMCSTFANHLEIRLQLEEERKRLQSRGVAL